MSAGSGIKVWWRCEKEHEWEARVYLRVKGIGCPECSNQRIGKDNNLAVLYPEIAKQLHPALNEDITAYDILPGSSKKVWWKCENEHKWETSVYLRTLKGYGCPECSNRRVGKDNNLAVLNPELIEEWDQEKNDNLTPSDVTAGSHKIVNWKCRAKNHKWKARICHRIKGIGCPECSNRRVGKDNNLAVLNPELIEEWDQEKNGNLTPSDVTAGSHKIVNWKCKQAGHEWKTEVRFRAIKNSGCQKCYFERKK